MNRVHLAPFPGSGLSAEMRRERIADELRGKRASIGIWLAVSVALSLAGWNLVNQLALLDAALSCAARV